MMAERVNVKGMWIKELKEEIGSKDQQAQSMMSLMQTAGTLHIVNSDRTSTCPGRATTSTSSSTARLTMTS